VGPRDLRFRIRVGERLDERVGARAAQPARPVGPSILGLLPFISTVECSISLRTGSAGAARFGSTDVST
jgi:hypothetical protein